MTGNNEQSVREVPMMIATHTESLWDPEADEVQDILDSGKSIRVLTPKMRRRSPFSSSSAFLKLPKTNSSKSGSKNSMNSKRSGSKFFPCSPRLNKDFDEDDNTSASTIKVEPTIDNTHFNFADRDTFLSSPKNKTNSIFPYQVQYTQSAASETREDEKELAIMDIETNIKTNVTNSSMQHSLQSCTRASMYYRPPTKLHEICIQIETVEDLMAAKSALYSSNIPKRQIVEFSSQRDEHGRTPLHLLSYNRIIFEQLTTEKYDDDEESVELPDILQQSSFDVDPSREKQMIKFILDVLFSAYPAAMSSHDEQGYIPFEGVLQEWIKHAHGDHFDLSQKSKQTPERVNNVWATTSSSLFNAVNWANRSTGHDKDNFEIKTPKSADELEHVEHGEISFSSENKNEGRVRASKERRRNRLFPNSVRLSQHVHFTLKILSMILEQLDKLASTHSMRDRNLKKLNDFELKISANSFDRACEEVLGGGEMCFDDISNEIIRSVSSIPDLVKTILLINDDEERQLALSSLVVRRAMMNKSSVGEWLTAMLQSMDKTVSGRAVDYLKIVSKMQPIRCSSSIKIKSKSDPCGAEKHNNELYYEISRLQDFVPSLLALGEKGIEDAATTAVVRRVMDKIISRPFAVSVVFFDGLFLALLIFCFREAVNRLLLGGSQETALFWIYLANTGIFYFVIRELGKAVSLCMITRQARIYFWSFWNLTDMLSTALALVSTATIRCSFTWTGLDVNESDGIRTLLAITTGFLWLRFLSLLKGINMQMATFVLAILQITRDIFWFCVILFTMVVTFAQMFYTLMVPKSCASNRTGSDGGLTCEESEYYLRVYTILLGDFGTFNRENFHTVFSVFLIVFYSFMVVIVLLNVLIAIASDSYEKCLVRSQRLFGRARVMLIAELVCFQNLLRGHDSQVHYHTYQMARNIYSSWWSNEQKGRSRGSVVFFTLSMLVICIWTAAEIVGFYFSDRNGSVVYRLVCILINLILFMAIISFLSTGAAGISRKGSSNGGRESEESTGSNRCHNFMQQIMLRLIGSSQEMTNMFRARRGVKSCSEKDTEWRGRVDYLQRRMDRIYEESMNSSHAQSKKLEQLVSHSEDRVRADMSNLEKQIQEFRSVLLAEFNSNEEDGKFTV